MRGGALSGFGLNEGTVGDNCFRYTVLVSSALSTTMYKYECVAVWRMSRAFLHQRRLNFCCKLEILGSHGVRSAPGSSLVHDEMQGKRNDFESVTMPCKEMCIPT